MEETQEALEQIAIVGMAGRFPGAKNLDEFWNNIKNGVESISSFTDEEAIASGLNPKYLKDPAFVKAHGLLDDIEMFDAPFFDMSPRDARILDPQHRIFLECAWEAWENAGYESAHYDGHVGVYAGTSFSTYLLRNILPNNLVDFPTIDRLEMALTNHKDTMPMRVSFQMNLTGPSISLGTTCSTSLVAIHLACQALLNYQCDMAMAGASFLRVPPKEGYLFQEGMIYSPDGHIRTFDAESKGIATGAGVGVVVLKLLEDAIADGDTIHAVIKASSLNNDGNTKIGYTAPSVDGQAEVIAEAISLAGINSDTVTYIEAHGTGTELGDPVEIAALTKAFRATSDSEKTQFCSITSAKPNIGHLNHAAGIAGFLKAILVLKNKQIPPSINFKTPNPKIDFANSPFIVNTELKDWKTDGVPRRAGVNAFGIGGTNAHIILEEAPTTSTSAPSNRPCQLLTISAKTNSALDTITANLAKSIEQDKTNLADVAYTLQMGRKVFNYRRILVCQNDGNLTELPPKQIATDFQKATERPVAFMFSGQGSQYVNMGRELYAIEPLFKYYIDTCADILKPHLDLDLRDILYPTTEDTSEQLQQTAITQPALFVIEYALAKLWMEWGIQPQAMIGHSIGEYVAACLAGVFSLEDALALVAARGKMMQTMPTGSMLAVPLAPEELQSLLTEGLSIAVINGPALCAVAGETDIVKEFEQQLVKKDIECSMLHTSHAFHSAMMQPIVAAFTDQVKQVKLQAPQIPYLSNVTGNWITENEATDPNYWGKHLRNTVQFAAGLQNLLQDPEQILLEVGPGRTLSTLAKQHHANEQTVLNSIRHIKDEQSDVAFLFTNLGKLWLAGTNIDWSKFYENETRHRVPLPTYPFERQRHWIDPPKPDEDNTSNKKPQLSLSRLDELEREEQAATSDQELSQIEEPRNPKEQKIAEVWIRVLGVKLLSIHDDFFDLGGSSLLASRLVAEICKELQADLSVQDFLSNPTVAELADLIEADIAVQAIPADKTPTSLVKIQAGSEHKKPLFLVHPIDGQVFFYRDLANCLSGQLPVYGFQSVGLAGEAEPLTTVEAMATHYLTIMRTVQPEGPYLLGGASFGGLVAFEMAQQLLAVGQKALLFQIDTPSVTLELFDLKDDIEILQFIFKYLLKLEISIDTNLSTEGQIKAGLKMARGKEPANFEVFQIKRLLLVIKANHAAIKQYSPSSYPEKFMFFRPQAALDKGDKYHAERFWLDFADGGIEINTVPGDHLSMNHQPNIKVVAKKLEIFFATVL